MSEKTYRWSCPQEWLLEKVSTMQEAELRQTLTTLVTLLADADTLQEIFQEEMESDLYFEPLESKEGDDDE